MFLLANKPGHFSKEMTNEKAFTKNKSSISKEILLDRAVFHLLMNNHAKWDVLSYIPHITTSQKEFLSKVMLPISYGNHNPI